MTGVYHGRLLRYYIYHITVDYVLHDEKLISYRVKSLHAMQTYYITDSKLHEFVRYFLKQKSSDEEFSIQMYFINLSFIISHSFQQRFAVKLQTSGVHYYFPNPKVSRTSVRQNVYDIFQQRGR